MSKKIAVIDDEAVIRDLVEDVLSGLREAKPPRHREILREYLLQVGKAVHKQNIKIELYPIEHIHKIINEKASFNELYERTINDLENISTSINK